MAIAGVLQLTAEQLADQDHLALKRWLADLSDRPTGFASVDLRGLSIELQLAFHGAARAAHKVLSSQDGITDSGSATYDVMTDLISMLDSMSRGEPRETPPTDCVRDDLPIAEDISELWNDE